VFDWKYNVGVVGRVQIQGGQHPLGAIQKLTFRHIITPPSPLSQTVTHVYALSAICYMPQYPQGRLHQKNDGANAPWKSKGKVFQALSKHWGEDKFINCSINFFCKLIEHVLH